MVEYMNVKPEKWWRAWSFDMKFRERIHNIKWLGMCTRAFMRGIIRNQAFYFSKFVSS